MVGETRRHTFVRFSSVNRRGRPGHKAGWQKHHLLPRQLARRACFDVMLRSISPEENWFDDFHTNRVLLPATEAGAVREQLPLHRGPHGIYNELVFERVGAVEMEWSRKRRRNALDARNTALGRIRLIQRALARRLTGNKANRHLLNRHDPIGKGVDFTILDAMAEQLWSATGKKLRP